MCDHAAQRELIIVRTREEVLLGIGVLRHQRAALDQRRAECRAFEPGHHHCAGGQFGILRADHLEGEVGDDVVERHWRAGGKGARSEAAHLLRPERREQYAALVPLAAAQRMGEFEHGRDARRIVVGAIHHCPVGLDAKVIDMRGEQDHPRLGIGAGQIADRVGGLDLFADQVELHRDRLARRLRRLVERFGREDDDRQAVLGRLAGEVGGQARLLADLLPQFRGRLARAEHQQLGPLAARGADRGGG